MPHRAAPGRTGSHGAARGDARAPASPDGACPDRRRGSGPAVRARLVRPGRPPHLCHPGRRRAESRGPESPGTIGACGSGPGSSLRSVRS